MDRGLLGRWMRWLLVSLSAAHVPSHARQLGTIGSGISFCLCPRSATLDSGPGTPQQCADHLVTDATSGGEEARRLCWVQLLLGRSDLHSTNQYPCSYQSPTCGDSQESISDGLQGFRELCWKMTQFALVGRGFIQSEFQPFNFVAIICHWNLSDYSWGWPHWRLHDQDERAAAGTGVELVIFTQTAVTRPVRSITEAC